MIRVCALSAILLLPLPAGAADPPAFPWQPTPSATAAYARAAAITELGRKLFFDPALSASGRTACATCHDPAHGFSAPNPLPVQLAGPDLRHPGSRSVPTLMYGQSVPAFSEHFFESEDEGDESVDQGPTGGRDWDGRVDRARDQAALPLFDNNEMANTEPRTLVAAVARAAYAGDVRHLYGQDIFADPPGAFAALTQALEFYQETPATFSPYSSKYDAFLLGRASLTPAEARGLAVFNNPKTGNCGQCHKSAVTPDGRPPLFTDFGFVALGLPRNRAIPANGDPAYFDLGLCGPQRHDLADNPAYCGMFKAPTLRNVALKQSFYHNGIFHSLRDAVAFYATRDTSPEKWFPTTPDGVVQKFDDLPAKYVANVSTELPFGPKRVLSDADVDDLVAFLRTLTDGYTVTPGATAHLNGGAITTAPHRLIVVSPPSP
ncbi:MAG: cytochrome c peroxidase [Acetobacteraceae bacterium]|nr:cytochrome c peroxidase [Acetobacteraceae bacterium]